MTGITVARTDDRVVAIKRAGPGEADRRRHEAVLLTRLDHPGIVELVEFVDREPIEIHLHYAGTDTWARTPPSTPSAIVEGLAIVAATIADLHDLDTAHRALTPEHVIVGADRRPILCGFADAGPADPAARAEDLDGLATLVDEVSRQAPDDLSNRLLRIADRARAGELSARRLTGEINALRRDSSAPGGRRRPAARIAAGVTGAAIVLLLAAVAIARGDSGSPPTAGSPAGVPSSTSTTLLASTTSSVGTPTTVPAPAPESGPDPVVLVHDGRRFATGEAGDPVVLGDWNCDGVATPAVLTRATGVVARFDQWPGPGASVAPDEALHSPTAVDLSVDEGVDCDRLRIIDPTGSSLFSEAP